MVDYLFTCAFTKCLCSMKNTGSCNCLLAALMSYSPWWGTDLWHFFFFDLLTCSAFAFLIYWANTVSVWLHRQEGFVSDVNCLQGERKFDSHVVLLRSWYLAGVYVWVRCRIPSTHTSAGSYLIMRERLSETKKRRAVCVATIYHDPSPIWRHFLQLKHTDVGFYIIV